MLFEEVALIAFSTNAALSGDHVVTWLGLGFAIFVYISYFINTYQIGCLEII